MNPFIEYIVDNFALLIASFGMFFIVIYNYRMKNRVSVYSILIIACALVISIFNSISEGLKKAPGPNPDLSLFVVTLLNSANYVLRPLEVLFFIFLAERSRPTLAKILIYISPLFVGIIIYAFPLFIGTPIGQSVFYITYYSETGTLGWNGGVLRFTAHIISAIYLGYLFFVSFSKIQAKHFDDAFVLISCSVFVVAATVIESIYEVYNIVNASTAISCVFYYLFLNNQLTRKDALTDLYGRSSFYDDTKRIRGIVGIIQIDMNGLKFFNDNFGHEAGDNALKTIAQVIKTSINRNMYAYRIGGDEFVVLSTQGNEDTISDICDKIRSSLLKTEYSCAIGWACRKGKEMSFDEMLKQAEQRMYKDKEIFYQNSKMERRKAERI